MRILFVSNNYTPYAGGVVSSINATIDALQKQGHDVTLITLDFLGQNHDDPSWVWRIPSLIRFRFRKKYMAIPWRPRFYLATWIQALKPDVVHVHHPFLLGPLAIQIAKKCGITTIFTYHTIYEAYAHYVPLPSWIIKPIIKKWVLSLCKKVDHIIAPSQGIKEYIRGYGITNITVIPSAVSSLFLSQPWQEKQIKKPYELLYVGRFVQEKNIPFLLDIMAQLPDEYHMTLIGYGDYATYVQEYAYRIRGLSPQRVRFIIQPDKSVLLACYKNAHLFVFASQTDTQGIVLGEAMACATPVIALDGCGQRDIICQGTNGFIVNNAPEMIHTIQSVMQDASAYRAMQAAAYKTAQVYSPATLVQSLCTTYTLTARTS